MTYPWTIEVPGASDADRARAVKALEVLFSSFDITPAEAAHAAFIISSPTGEWTDRHMTAAKLWDKVPEVVIEACTQGWPEIPKLSSCNIALDPAFIVGELKRGKV